jgi:hypothetical protein
VVSRFNILRIVAALLFMEHGLQKYFGFPSAGPPMTTLLYVQGVIEIIAPASQGRADIAEQSVLAKWPCEVATHAGAERARPNPLVRVSGARPRSFL